MDDSKVKRSSVWQSRLELFATVLLVLVTLMVGAFALVDRSRPAPGNQDSQNRVQQLNPPVSMSLDQTPVRGDRAAKVALVVFSDFQCPVCARAERELMPELEASYIQTGKVLLIWRHDPLKRHSLARGAAEATECAQRQGKFWELHDWAFAHQSEITPANLRAAVAGFDVNMSKFDSCLTKEGVDRISSELALAEQLGVDGTPTWFIGKLSPSGTVSLVNRISGFGPAGVFTKAIDNVLKSR
jgi:protein-disulfide isomerase